MLYTGVKLIKTYLGHIKVRNLSSVTDKMNQVCSVDKAYVRFSKDHRFQMTLRYHDEHLKVDRIFNFNRSLSENVTIFLKRVETNIEKAVFTKKYLKSVTGGAKLKPDLKARFEIPNGLFDEELTCSKLFSLKEHILLHIAEKEYILVKNAPWIENVVLPKAMMSGFPIYPSKFECYNMNREISEFKWYKSVDKHEWMFVASGFIYIPSNADVGCFLKLACFPKNEENEGPCTEVISTIKVEANPGKCLFERRTVPSKHPYG